MKMITLRLAAAACALAAASTSSAGEFYARAASPAQAGAQYEVVSYVGSATVCGAPANKFRLMRVSTGQVFYVFASSLMPVGAIITPTSGAAACSGSQVWFY